MAGDVHNAFVVARQATFFACGRVEKIELGVFVAAAVTSEEQAVVAGRG